MTEDLTLLPLPIPPADLPAVAGDYEYRVLTVPWGTSRSQMRRLLSDWPKTAGRSWPGSGCPSAAKGATSAGKGGRRSAGRQETSQHADTEPERLDRHPFVHAVEHAREIQVRRQPQRREPVAGDPEVAQ